MTGMRPVVDIMFGDFLTLAMDQLVNQAAKIHYMSGGRLKAPMVLRTTLGADAPLRRPALARASMPVRAHPGLKVVLPSTPADAKGLLKTAIRDDNPVVFFEDKMMYAIEGPGPGRGVHDPVRRRGRKREGDDVTLVATSAMVHVALAAAERLAARASRRGGRSADDSCRSTARRWSRRHEDRPGHRPRRGLPELRRDCRARRRRRRGRLLPPRRAGAATGRDGRAGPVLARRWRTRRCPRPNGRGRARRSSASAGALRCRTR